MNYEIKQEDKRTVAGFHLVVPWEQTVKKGFEQLMMWIDSKNIVPKEWVNNHRFFLVSKFPKILLQIGLVSNPPVLS